MYFSISEMLYISCRRDRGQHEGDGEGEGEGEGDRRNFILGILAISGFPIPCFLSDRTHLLLQMVKK